MARPRRRQGARLEGLWNCSSLTRLERIPVFKSLEVDAAEARRAPFLLAKDDVGNRESEWFDADLGLAQINGRFRTSWIVDPANGRLPFSEAGLRLMRATEPSFDGPEARPMNERCLSAGVGPPMLNGLYNNNWAILETPDAVLIVTETNHEARIVHLRDASPDARRPPTWMGHSCGRWDGDTLMVTTTNFAPSQSRRRGGTADLYISPEARVTETFERTSDRQILYRYTVDDPAVFTRVWRAEMPLNATAGPMFEYACHEGNYSLRGTLGGARAQAVISQPGQR